MCNPTLLSERQRVLIVDSDADSLYLTRLVLESQNVEAQTVTNAKTAMEQLSAFWPDLVISELCLPKQDGFCLARQLGAFSARHNVYIPAIALTTQISLEDRVQAITAGFCQHITKPVNIQELITAVMQILANKKPLYKSQQKELNHCLYCV